LKLARDIDGSGPIFQASRFEGHTGRMRHIVDGLTLKETESPIEATLFESLERIPWPAGVEIKRQMIIGRYRVDFMLGRRLENGRADCLVAIECDGREFHRPEEDAPRDRFIQIHGAAVLRFCGAEIQRHPDKCAGEVLEWMEAAIKRAAK
jgi:very-short-patch-repair endonuclease